MGRLPIGIGLVLASALGCGRVEQRVVEEDDTTTTGGKSAQAGRGGSTSAAGAATGGMGAMANAPATGGVGGIVDPACGGGPNPLPLQALSNFEYARSVEAVVQIAMAEPFPPTVSYGPFGFGLNDINVTTLFDFAETYGLAAKSTLRAPCAGAEINETCARSIIQPLVQRAFRRQSLDDEDRYLALFNTGASDGGWDGGLELLTEGVLLSPAFLFKWYPGEPGPGETRPLTSLEIASRLSYFVTGGPPDQELLSAASHDDLAGDSSIEEQTRRLLAGPHFQRQAQYFYDQWFGLHQLENVAGPEVSADLLKSVRTQTDSFISQVFASDRSWPRLLLGDSPDVRDPSADSGLLTARSTLMRWRTPTQRGKLVRERLFCMPVPAPPPNVIPIPPEAGPGQTRRDQWIQHRTDPVCSGCHTLMDPIGFGLENFDEMGLYRTTDNGQPVDASGDIVSAGDADGPFVGPEELKQRLANSATVAQCQAAAWRSFALQRAEEYDEGCFDQQVYAAFANSGFDIGELIVKIALSPQFRTRDHHAGGPSNAAPPIPSLPSSVVGKAARRKVVLDFALAETQWLITLVSSEDRPVLEQYVSGLRDQQAKLGNIP
jgi:hypothetical protein